MTKSALSTQQSHPEAGGWLLTLAVQRLFKEDRRSRVWLVSDNQGKSWVIKRFNYSPWRQRLAGWLGVHPAQCERRWHGKMRRSGLPVVPVVHWGVEPTGIGCRYWLATPLMGDSLYHWVMDGQPARQPAQRHAIARQLGQVTGKLLALGWLVRDYKASNWILDQAGSLHLIDAGIVRRRWGAIRERDIVAVLGMLHKNLRNAAGDADNTNAVKPTRSDRLRYYRAMVQAWPQGKGIMAALVRNFVVA